MRLTRLVTAIALGMSLMVAGHASAAAKSCNLIKDPAGDAADALATGVQVPGANDKMKDILGADFAANTSTVTGQIKLAQAPGLNPYALSGMRFYLEFSSGSRGLFLRASSDTTGAMSYNVGKLTTGATGGTSFETDDTIPVKGKVVGSTIVMTVATSKLKPLVTFKKGGKINNIFASTYGVISTPATGLLLGGDTTDPAEKPYVFGTKSCLVPVK
jgi:hypothetical protein